MPYENLYRAHALDGSLFYTVSVRKAALLIALDSDIRDQSLIEAELPNEGDYAVWMSPELEPAGKLKSARDTLEKAILKSLEAGRLKADIVARNAEDRIDPIYTLASFQEIEDWCLERDISLGEWWAQYKETEFEYASAMVDEIAGHVAPVSTEWEDVNTEEFQSYKDASADQQAMQYRQLLSELRKLKESSRGHTEARLDAPINTREKNSLLVIIAALVDALSEKLPEAYKRAEAISVLTEKLGATVSINTVDKYLKQMPEAVDRRRQDSR